MQANENANRDVNQQEVFPDWYDDTLKREFEYVINNRKFIKFDDLFQSLFWDLNMHFLSSQEDVIEAIVDEAISDEFDDDRADMLIKTNDIIKKVSPFIRLQQLLYFFSNVTRDRNN